MQKIPPLLIVGLGNPGAQYALTRHNAGFWFIDRLAAHFAVTFSSKKNFHADFAAADCRLLRPTTFMNHSGRAVAAACHYFRLSPAQILVAHDEADLSPGAVKLKFGGGNAGHNGLADISRALNSRDYWRLRLGVGQIPGAMANYVLSRPPPAEREMIDSAIMRALNLWEDIAAGQWEKTMKILHTNDTTAAADN